MSTCKTCREPANPVYSKAKPEINHNCGGCGGNANSDFYIPPAGSGGKTTEIIAGESIKVTDLSTSLVDKFEVAYDPSVDLTVTLTLQAYIASVLQSGYMLKGKIIDEVRLSWSYNKDIISQILTNNDGLVAPDLAFDTRAHNYVDQNITEDISFTIQGEDGITTKNAVKSVLFGNYAYHGHGASLTGKAMADLEAMLPSLAKVIKRSRGNSLYATGGANEYFYYIYPKAWGLASFKKYDFTGGYVRMKLVGTTLKKALSDADVETDIILDNGTGFTEPYYVYISEYDNQNDPATPIEIS